MQSRWAICFLGGVSLVLVTTRQTHAVEITRLPGTDFRVYFNDGTAGAGVAGSPASNFRDGNYSTDFKINSAGWATASYAFDRLYDVTSYSYGDNVDADRVRQIDVQAGGSASQPIDTSTSNGSTVTPMNVPFTARVGIFRINTWGDSAANSGGSDLEVFGTPTNFLRLPAPTIIAAAPSYDGGTGANPLLPSFYSALNVQDGNIPWPFYSEYASQGKGADTFIDFDFGSAKALGAVETWDRMNNGFTAARLTFSTNSTFGDSDDIVVDYSDPGLQQVVDLTTAASTGASTSNPTGITARYVRWQPTVLSDANTGIKEIVFYSSPVPEPGALAFGVGLGLAGLMRRTRRPVGWSIGGI